MAAHWWARGAANGDADGQAMLGARTSSALAYRATAWRRWRGFCARAVAVARLPERFLGGAGTGLSPEQIAEAERRAAAALPEPSS